MADGEKVDQLVAGISNNAIQLEIERLKKVLYSMRDYEIMICTEFGNLEIGQITETFLHNKDEQLTCMDHSKVTKLMQIVNAILETNRQKISINKMILEQNVPTKEKFNELKETTINELLELDTFLKKLIDVKNYRNLIEEAINSTYEENNDFAINRMLSELWSDSE